MGKHYKMGPMYSVECDLPSWNGKPCESTSFDENWCMCNVLMAKHKIYWRTLDGRGEPVVFK